MGLGQRLPVLLPLSAYANQLTRRDLALVDFIAAYYQGLVGRDLPLERLLRAALGEGRALAQALSSIAQQPDEAGTITRTLFVGLAMVESTAIYCFVVAMILIFANPFWNHVIAAGG